MTEKRGRWGRRRGTLGELQRKGKYCGCSRCREQWGEIQALAAGLLAVRSLLMGGGLGGRGLVSIGVRDRAELSDE
jgi:hypothetical protein